MITELDILLNFFGIIASFCVGSFSFWLFCLRLEFCGHFSKVQKVFSWEQKWNNLGEKKINIVPRFTVQMFLHKW